MNLDPWTWYWISVAALTALLFVPVSRMIWVMSVRRLERKTQHRLSDADRLGQLGRARFIALVVSAIFSLLFNYQILGMSDLG